MTTINAQMTDILKDMLEAYRQKNVLGKILNPFMRSIIYNFIFQQIRIAIKILKYFFFNFENV